MNNSQIIKTFIVEDDHAFATIVKKHLEIIPDVDFDISHYSTGKECMENLNSYPDLVILDLDLPDQSGLDLLKKFKKYNGSLKTIILSGQQDVEVTVNVYKEGVDYYILKSANCWEEFQNAVKKLANYISLKNEVAYLKEEIIDRNKYSKIIGTSPAILQVLKLVQKVEKSNITVLITGESGTGKELVARSLHYNSPRKKNRFIPINVPAIPEDLIESELFGHEKGAFTGAINKRIGKFEEADGGTIFLDEIGEMDLNLQSKLLRVLQENEVVRVGGNKIRHIDVRILASTNRDLDKEVKEEKFRKDLFYRINGFLVKLPPLIERGDDIIILAKHFLKEFCASNKLPDMNISKDGFDAIKEHNWPGNVRELKSVIERAALLTDSSTINKENIVF